MDDFGKTIEKYTSLSELCMDSKSDLETIIEEIDAFLTYWGERLQHGMISDIDYFQITEPYIAWNALVQRFTALPYKTVLMALNKHYFEFEHSYAFWKENKKIPLCKWLYTGDNYLIKDEQALALRLFQLIDALKVPVSYFMPIECEKQPQIIYCSNIDKKEVSMMLTQECRDIAQVFVNKSPDRKLFKLHFDYDTTAKIFVEESTNYGYIGFGSIEGYLEPFNSKIEIWKPTRENTLGSIVFNRKSFPRDQILFQTYVYQIPHPQWREYDILRLEKAYKVEAEYKTLRIPYMVGKNVLGY